MKHNFPILPVLALAVLGVVAPNLKADGWDKRTNITIDQPIEVGGTILPPGSYVLKLVNPDTERHLVKIFSAGDGRVVATVSTIPAYRSVPAADNEFKFYEAKSGQPPALRTWFYPGDPFGFAFEPSRGASTAQAAQHSIPAPTNVSTN